MAWISVISLAERHWLILAMIGTPPATAAAAGAQAGDGGVGFVHGDRRLRDVTLTSERLILGTSRRGRQGDRDWVASSFAWHGHLGRVDINRKPTRPRWPCHDRLGL